MEEQQRVELRQQGGGLMRRFFCLSVRPIWFPAISI